MGTDESIIFENEVNTMNEKVKMHDYCNYKKSSLITQHGYGILTDQRFIFSKHSLVKCIVMGELIDVTKANYEFDIPLCNIHSITKRGNSFNKNILVIKLGQGDVYKFSVNHYSIWENAFKDVMEGVRC